MSTQNTSLDAFWMPFTANRQYKSAPRILVGAEGMHYTTDDGRKILDGTAGLWCTNAGHARTEITEAVQNYYENMRYDLMARTLIMFLNQANQDDSAGRSVVRWPSVVEPSFTY